MKRNFKNCITNRISAIYINIQIINQYIVQYARNDFRVISLTNVPLSSNESLYASRKLYAITINIFQYKELISKQILHFQVKYYYILPCYDDVPKFILNVL